MEQEEIELEGILIYNNNGNLIGNNLNNKRQYIYSYDYKNRLVKIEKNIYKKVIDSETNEVELVEKIVQIKYDVLGRRIQKLFNNGSYRNYIYSNQHVILEENYSKKDKLKNSKEFTYSNSLDDVLSMKLIENKTRKIKEEYVNAKGNTKTRKIKEEYTEANTYFYQKDHLGSIIAITDETGTIVEEYVYDIFGKPYTKKLNGTITALKKSPIGNTRMYTGREYDRGLKLYYNRARYYNPQLGRFISRDPIDIADDVNLYAYVGNNSVMFVDRLGTEKVLIFSAKDIFSIAGDGLAISNSVRLQKKLLLNIGIKEKNIVLESGNNIDSFISSITKRKYSNIYMVTHSNRDALDLDANISNNIDNIINSENLSKLPSDLGSDTILTLLACHSGNGDNSIAEKISKQMNITVKAPEGYIGAGFGKFLDLGTSKWDILTNEYNKIISKEAEFLTFKP